MDFNDYDREEIMDLAIDIIDNTDATLEEAMGIAMETAYDRNQMMDIAEYVYNRDIADMAIEASMIDNINNEHENYGSIEDKVDYSKLMPGYQRATAKKLSKMIDEYVAMPWVDDKAKLGHKIVRILSTPVIKEFLVKSGYWDQIPTSIKQLGKRDAQLYKALNDTAWSASAKLLTDKKFRSQLKRGIKNAITHKKKQTAKKATESAYAPFKDDDERKKYDRVQSLSELSKSDIEKHVYRARLLPDDRNHITLKDFVRVGSEMRKFLKDQRNKKQNDAISEYWK